MLLLLVSPVGEVPFALLVLPAPLLSTNELDLAELPLPPEASLGLEIVELLAVGADAEDAE